MLVKIIFLLFAAAVFIAPAHAEPYVFDNAKMLKDTGPLEKEIGEFVNKHSIFIVVETDSFEEERGLVVENSFARHDLYTKGRPSFNMVLLFNVAKKELYYRVSKGCELEEQEITEALGKPEITGATDYDKMLLEAVKSLEAAVEKKLANYVCKVPEKRACKPDVEKPEIKKRVMKYTYKGKIKPTAVVLHYIDFPGVEDAVKVLEGYGFSVQLMVEKDGTIYQLTENLDDMSEGTQCANAYSISVEIVGNEQSLLENQVQYSSVLKLVKWLSKEYDIDLSKSVAKRPQKGLLGHSEVAALCAGSDKKSDPGDAYMQLVRAEACMPPNRAGAGIVIDLTQGLSAADIASIEAPILEDKRWKSRRPSIFLIALNNQLDSLYPEALKYAEDADADCVVVAETGQNYISFSRKDCALSDAEFSRVLSKRQKEISEGANPGKQAAAMKDVAFDVAEGIYLVSKHNEELKKAGEENLIAILSSFFTDVGSSIYGTIFPVSLAAGENKYASQAEKVMERAAKFPIYNPFTLEIFEGAKSKFSPTPNEVFSRGRWSADSGSLGDRLLRWHEVLNPKLMSPSVRFFGFSQPSNLQSADFAIDIPAGLFCRIEITNRPTDFQLSGSSEKETNSKIVFCGSAKKITVGPEGDCFNRGADTCEIVVTEGIVFKNRYELVFSIDYDYYNSKTSISPNADKIASRFIQAIYKGVDAANKNKFSVKITPEELYTISVGEGMVRYLREAYFFGNSYISGFDDLGVDTIGNRIDYLKKSNFIRNDFALDVVKRRNEKNEEVLSAYFIDIDDAMEAAAAMVALSKSQFLQDAANLGIDVKTLTRRQMNFWTYFYFNCGEGCGYKQLRKFVSSGRLDDEGYINARPGEIIMNGRNARHNSVIRAVVMEFMYDSGMLALEKPRGDVA